MIIAKPVIPNQFWILKDGDIKVGNIEAGPAGFEVKINNQVQSFKTLNSIKKEVAVDFEPSIRKKAVPVTNQVHGYSTSSKPFNAIYDVKHQVPLWTKELVCSRMVSY